MNEPSDYNRTIHFNNPCDKGYQMEIELLKWSSSLKIIFMKCWQIKSIEMASSLKYWQSRPKLPGMFSIFFSIKLFSVILLLNHKIKKNCFLHSITRASLCSVMICELVLLPQCPDTYGCNWALRSRWCNGIARLQQRLCYLQGPGFKSHLWPLKFFCL